MTTHTFIDIRDWLHQAIADILEVAPHELSIYDPLADYGLSSRETLLITGELEDLLNRELSATLIWSYPTIDALAKHLSGEETLPERAEIGSDTHSPLNDNEPIAVIGIGCRFPGANDPDEFWQLLKQKKDAISKVPADRWNAERFYHPTVGRPGKMNTVWGGFLENVAQFDAHFFGISPREGERIDPQQRLLLEVTWEAFENAGLPPDTLAGTKSGVFIGISSNDYGRLQNDPNTINAYTGLGNATSIAANRISYTFDLRGPSLTIDTACSSSLVAIHQACQSLQTGESTLAIAGGVNLILSPEITISFTHAGMMAANGRCRTFDDSAEGYVRSEGCGIVILKPLAAALADGDTIITLIRGSAINQDGRSNGITAPNQLAQEAAIKQALTNAHVHPHQISYIETHGTGTPLGDPIEIAALKAVFLKGRQPDHPCAFGSVKANIGHLESAAGVAGFIKTALCLYHGEIPPQPHLQQLNKHINLKDTPFTIPTQHQPWFPTVTERIAGVSSFGFGGTNAHIILQQPAPVTPTETPVANVYLLTLSAKSKSALQKTVHRTQTWLKTTPASLTDICYTAARHRTHHPYRLAFTAHTPDQLNAQLTQIRNDPPPIPSLNTPKLIFVFSGQGAHWLGMGQQLFAQEPLFRTTIQACDAAMQPYTDWSVLTELQAAPTTSQLERTDVRQPMLFSIQVALAALWQSWGIKPDILIGHSMGEIAAAHVMGALTLDDACRIVCRRSQIMRQTSGKGTMALVELPQAQAQELVDQYPHKLAIGAVNTPNSTVLSGDPNTLKHILDKLETQNIFGRFVKIDTAPHSPQMDPLLPDIHHALTNIKPQTGHIPLYSTVDLTVKDGSELTADYWVRGLRDPVLFAPAITTLTANIDAIFLEISPHPIISPSIQRNLNGANAITLPSLRRQDDTTLYHTLATLYTLGASINWERLYPTGNRVTFPRYAWDRQHLWFTSQASNTQQQRTYNQQSPLLGHPMVAPAPSQQRFWELKLEPNQFSYLNAFTVNDRPLLPTALLVEMMLAAANEIHPTPILTDITFTDPVTLDKAYTTQLIITPHANNTTFELLIQATDDTPFTRHSAGHIINNDAPSTLAPIDLTSLQTSPPILGATLYETFATHQIIYQKALQTISQLWRSDEHALAAIELPAIYLDTTYQIHPILLDACFQAVAALFPNAKRPIHITTLQQHHPTPQGQQRWAYARKTSSITADLFLTDEQGQILLSLSGIHMAGIHIPQTTYNPFTDWLYELTWEAHPLHPNPETDMTTQNGCWLILADTGDIATNLITTLETKGEQYLHVTHSTTFQRLSPNHYTADTTHLSQLLQTAFDANTSCKGIIYLWGLNISHNHDLHTAEKFSCIGILHLSQAIAQAGWRDDPRLWLITRNTQYIPQTDTALSIYQSPIWGLGRVITHEYPAQICTRIDLSPHTTLDEHQALATEILTASPEDQVALRGQTRYVSRLMRHQSHPNQLPITARQRPFQLTHHQNSFHLQTAVLTDPAPNQVTIQLYAASINIQDHHTASTNSHECAGVITAIGQNVTQFTLGDEVIAVASGKISNYITLPASHAIHKPQQLNFTEAATLPISLTTAYYALHHLAHLQSEHTILIHNATTNIGLAAIQLAQKIGATIFATTITDDQHATLQTQGIQHIATPHTITTQIRQATNGHGVDIILNTNTNDNITYLLDNLAPYGRFLQVGSISGYIPPNALQHNCTLTTIDIPHLAQHNPQQLQTLLKNVVQLIDNDFIPIPQHIYPITQIDATLRQPVSNQKTSTPLLTFDDAQTAPLTPRLSDDLLFRSDATYLITGGLGGLGLVFARWLCANGAKHLILVSRRSTPAPAIQAQLDDMRTKGTHITVAQGDVSQASHVQRILNNITHNHPPLRGILHCAAVLDDAILMQQTPERFRAVMAPKVDGAWHLHTLTDHIPLDFFVLFSSIAALFGSPGQANYAAANAFLDALALHRRLQGKVGLSINWGPWADVGLAATQTEQGNTLTLGGIRPIPPHQGTAVLRTLLQQNTPQVSVIPLNLRQWQQYYLTTAHSPLFANLTDSLEERPAYSNRLRHLLQETEPHQRRTLLEDELCQHITRVLRMESAQINALTPLGSLGLDSLMAMELRNRLEDETGLTLSVTLIWNYQTIADLTPYLADKMGLSLPTPTPTPTSSQPTLSQEESDAFTSLLNELNNISLDELQEVLINKEN